MKTETALARAKVNLCLHVTGQRADGYHLLDSLVVFAGVGDQITVQAADRLSLQITGPQAANLPVSDDNLVLRAARLFGGVGAQITLDKHLPIASGIGGGSADAAATLRAMCALWEVPVDNPRVVDLAGKLGADVPVCLGSRTAYFGDIGTALSPAPDMPEETWVLLINPGVSMPTKAVFEARGGRFSNAARLDRKFEVGGAWFSAGTDSGELAGLYRHPGEQDSCRLSHWRSHRHTALRSRQFRGNPGADAVLLSAE